MRTLQPALLIVVLICLVSLGLWLVRGDMGGIPGSPVSDALGPAHSGGKGSVADLPGGVVHLVVLNGTEVPDLAGDLSLLLGSAGCVADRIGNAPHARFTASLLVNRRLDDDRAAELARRLGGPVLLLERDPGATEDAVLVLGADHGKLRSALLAD